MVYLKYKNFDDLYHSLSRLPLNEYSKYESELIKSGSTYYMNDVIIETPSFDCSIDMSILNYTMAKWNTLINKYVDVYRYSRLREKLSDNNTKTCTFNFKIHDEGKDACIIALVFSRDSTKVPWEKVDIFYRITDCVKKFAVDLILLNRMFTELPNLDIKSIIFHFPKLFFRVEFLTELIGGYFSLDEFTEDNFATNHVKDLWNKYYGEGASLSNYHTVARKQKLKKRSEKLPSIPIESLKIFEGIENNLF